MFAADHAGAEFADRKERQARGLERLGQLGDMELLASDEMWR